MENNDHLAAELIGMIARSNEVASTGPTTVNANINVTENRAPTDDSVRLLGEMEAAIEKNIVSKTISGSDNVVTGTVLQINRLFHEFQDNVYVAFNLNGVEHILQVPVKHREAPPDPSDKIELLLTKVSEAISAKLLQDHQKDVVESAFFRSRS